MKTETDLDVQSRPMRNAIQQWARDRGLGFSGGWHLSRRCWIFNLDRASITVEILEDGSVATCWTDPDDPKFATTPRGLRMVLTKLYEERKKNDERR